MFDDDDNEKINTATEREKNMWQKMERKNQHHFKMFERRKMRMHLETWLLWYHDGESSSMFFSRFWRTSGRISTEFHSVLSPSKERGRQNERKEHWKLASHQHNHKQESLVPAQLKTRRIVIVKQWTRAEPKKKCSQRRINSENIHTENGMLPIKIVSEKQM